jgi:hypothetical protein
LLAQPMLLRTIKKQKNPKLFQISGFYDDEKPALRLFFL